MSIIVKHVSKTYGSQKALDDVSFQIGSGEIVGFIGPNGAGKSTMMKIITGFLPASSGDVWVNDIHVLDDTIEVRRHIGYLPENNPLYPDMYVREYLEFVAGIYDLGKDKTARIDEIIQKTGLEVEQRKKIGALSKGYRQRVGLAQALIHNPSILILDEPTSGLDPNQIVEIRNLISECGKEKTVILSTHIMQEVEAICDRVIIINKGKIIANDSAQNMHQHTAEKFLTTMVEFNGDIDENELLNLPGVNKAAKLKNNQWLVQSSPDHDVRQDIFNLAVAKNLAVLSMQKHEKNLEEIFQELTR
ncbi:MAG: gliding motility-associated ABC transporter ATP-binding subunit GldA [Bacteroidota bacterium]|nr:gliding motility-associated ABC transporter ATP-binding subunit GldA [Bacteroidota bacterium]MDP4275476.1 gliding motility-associated ABC transporter ATP-binding subunit GldA [Bacteroidota bacterium]